jgi:hypothetical protein
MDANLLRLALSFRPEAKFEEHLDEIQREGQNLFKVRHSVNGEWVDTTRYDTLQRSVRAAFHFCSKKDGRSAAIVMRGLDVEVLTFKRTSGRLEVAAYDEDVMEARFHEMNERDLAAGVPERVVGRNQAVAIYGARKLAHLALDAFGHYSLMCGAS